MFPAWPPVVEVGTGTAAEWAGLVLSTDVVGSRPTVQYSLPQRRRGSRILSDHNCVCVWVIVPEMWMSGETPPHRSPVPVLGAVAAGPAMAHGAPVGASRVHSLALDPPQVSMYIYINIFWVRWAHRRITSRDVMRRYVTLRNVARRRATSRDVTSRDGTQRKNSRVCFDVISRCD